MDEETIRSIKVGLQGPLAGIGDSLIQATLLPILMTITLALCAETGSIAGPLFYIVALFGIMIPLQLCAVQQGLCARQQGLRSGKAGNPQPHYRGNFHVWSAGRRCAGR